MYSIDEHFTSGYLPPAGWYYDGSIPQSAAFWTCCNVLNVNTMGTNGYAYYGRDDDLALRDRWQLQTMIQILAEEGGPWATFFQINNSQFTVDVSIHPGYVEVAGIGNYAFPWRGPIWHTYFATGDKNGWKMYVNGDLIYNGGYRTPYNPTPRPYGSLAFGDGNGGADAYWQMDYFRYSSELDSPEPAWMGVAGLVLIAVGYFGRKR